MNSRSHFAPGRLVPPLSTPGGRDGAARLWQETRCYFWAQPQLQVTFAKSFPRFVLSLPPQLSEAIPRALPEGCSPAQSCRWRSGCLPAPCPAFGWGGGGGGKAVSFWGEPHPATSLFFTPFLFRDGEEQKNHTEISPRKGNKYYTGEPWGFPQRALQDVSFPPSFPKPSAEQANLTKCPTLNPTPAATCAGPRLVWPPPHQLERGCPFRLAAAPNCSFFSPKAGRQMGF